ncbi:sugar ABC transporter permease (plasmid) [Deinococcus metallilatus]|uniref:Sugar ABC transporter permease n=1 Tax=Deinococcus metallilatus TaxID=1211322 RepID=A0AAJ5F807_9DEIO|nr:sugar ABC transporter permease [Deinococcus metallilatus]RXJ18155.1 sugar ABC transporter permease [Deinococcus metallilatus]TLK32361.1 sugar ABC transporter permease [Deinococcus metallilatus]
MPWYLFLPAILPIVLFSVLPLCQGIWLGFTEYRLGQDAPTFNGLANFAQMLKDTDFLSSFKVGLIWTFAVTGGVLFFGMGLALLLNARLPLQGLARVLVLVPWAIPPVIKGLIWRMVYHPDAGFLNQGLAALGFPDLHLNVLTDFTWALPAVILVGIWAGLPQATVVLLAGLQSIPDELKEAAALDGAGSWGILRHVTLPLMMPVIAATAALEFMWNFNAFGLVYVLTDGGPAGSTRLPMLFAYEEAFQYGNIGYASALGLAMVVVVGVLVYYTVRRQAQGGDA